ncbi:thiamine pyrophosphokinase [Salirhabdus euzebyi]|uniref:Thiamine diphosphokinase n=1 Tax=Salirhabdus euzebyi TaxID=394506 RepID=A0A841Q3K4_9BACI|nr:thiamine diphosphokinase [Salirhabdus euzebyi]MBB6452968.1 thiamine pyrophosphokinase [Salirhabdus euzebyi]
MKIVGVVGGGPAQDLPDLKEYDSDSVFWIGADRGNLTLLEHNIIPQIGVGDFDSINADEMLTIDQCSIKIETYSTQKDETDLELAIQKAIEINPDIIYLFGVTGGRLDHELINIHMLYRIEKAGIKGVLINKSNWIELKLPGMHKIEYEPKFKYISFIPQSLSVLDLTLEGFIYPLKDKEVQFGSTLCISNQLNGKIGTFSFTSGILIVVKSRDVLD